ncbi:1-deoxy-D-xylulose-5-phosphate synthase [Dickeya dianthicola]|uniref:Transketolase n=1 Tax=Dickeya dianthicola TaxID=204039 RepID=A0AAP6RW95_9GAMM|nr:transketolase C-terminal domain-containing protein [Dickeya dianthicola]AYC17363.1 1-deoxy-D-xylulose-5-phosphate synthase [Dickeya dianthicola]MBI0439806.1 transketolase family protein [Dickeya dianthicola]MBI0450527.1 transketolase family protein [Dickeya dianthicola]MBI0455087.1 transketolase family protein [Dickeya dianthicola]MBI0459275.1 transketolase family protein [Dickeya dianthicola]
MQDLRDAVVATLLEEQNAGANLCVVVADSTSTSKIAPFEKAFPERVVNVGIAEQNMVGMAAGLSLSGPTVFTANAAPFLLARSNEQVKNDVCYTDANVKMLGLNAGFAYGPLGATHHCMNDIAIARSMGNLQIFAPADAVQASAVARHAIAHRGPVYIRMDSDKLPLLHDRDWRFTPGQPVVLQPGSETVVFCLGTLAHEALAASADITVVSLPSLWPLDEMSLLKIISEHQYVISMEEHVLSGGLGSIIGELLHKHHLRQRFTSLGVPPYEFTHSSSRGALRRQFHIDAAGLRSTLEQLALRTIA